MVSIWILDAAHGGSDAGIIAANGRKESDIVLEAVLEAKKHLERNGEKVILTRSDDTYLSNEDRIKLANEAGVHCLVSFRMNQDNDVMKRGVKVSYLKNDEEEKRLAGLIKSEIYSNINTVDLGISYEETAIFRELNAIGVLVYGEYLSNVEVADNFDEKKYGMMVAKACLAWRDKVLLLMPKTSPKKLQKRAYRVCIGYYYDYDSAMDKVIELNGIGIKDAYVAPYDGS